MFHWIVYTYWPEVRGNVYAILPCAIVAIWWSRSKHLALRAAQKTHAQDLKRILEHLDPEAATDGLLDIIADRTDENTPGGIGAILSRLPRRKEKQE